MTVKAIKDAVMFQTNNDADDVGDFLPSLVDYINDGYDRLVYAYAGEHISGEDGAAYAPLEADADKPALPEWTHGALADWATWCVYRNGNSQKQQRGYAFRSSFEEICQRITAEGGAAGRARNFVNIPW